MVGREEEEEMDPSSRGWAEGKSSEEKRRAVS